MWKFQDFTQDLYMFKKLSAFNKSILFFPMWQICLKQIWKKHGCNHSNTGRIIMSLKNKIKKNFDVQNSKLSILQYFPDFFKELKHKLSKFNSSLITKQSIKFKIYSLWENRSNWTKPIIRVYERTFNKDNIDFYEYD